MKHDIAPGDMVVLGAENGLGTSPFLVLKVYPENLIHNLLVRGKNGIWPARSAGAKIVSRMHAFPSP